MGIHIRVVLQIQIFSMDHTSVAPKKNLAIILSHLERTAKACCTECKIRASTTQYLLTATRRPVSFPPSLSLLLALGKLISFHTTLSLSPYHLLSSVSCIHSFGKDSSVLVYKHYPSKSHSCKLQTALPFLSLFLRLSISRSQVYEAYVMVIPMYF